MPEERESQPMSVEARALELAARVTVRRISNVISHEKRSRVMYALVDLGSALTSAIGRALADRSREDAKIEVAIHPELAIDGLSDELRTSEEATRFRNRKREGVVATVFSVPARQMEGVLQSLGTVERVNEAWLCDPAKANLWTTETLPDYRERIQEQFEEILRGVMDSGILASAEMLATFCAEVHEGMENPQGLDLGSAVNHALPALRLPRECAPDMKAKTLAAKPAVQFRRWRDEFQPHLYLEAKDGQVRPRQELLVRIDNLMKSGDLTTDAAQALRDLVNDLELTAGIWRPSQKRVVELPWGDVQAFFRDRARTPNRTLGQETIDYLDDEFSTELSDEDREVLGEVRHETNDASPEQEAVFLRHRERLSLKGKLYKRWERFVFNKPIEEVDDLCRGLIRLAERACQNAEDIEDPVLFVRLRGADKMSFWIRDKNTDLCAYLRDRYRGLDKALSPWTRLDFGRCWKEDWEARLDEGNKNENGGANAKFEFEAFLASKAGLAGALSDWDLWGNRNKAQMVWKPGNATFATALSGDLKQVMGQDGDRALLLRSKVAAARSARAGSSERATIGRVTSITDSRGGSRGALAGSGRLELGTEWNWIEELCGQKLDEHAHAELSQEKSEKLKKAFDTFHSQYTEAIREMTAHGGAGLAAKALINQAESYGVLLHELRESARAEILVRDVWEPILRIGTATVSGDADAMIVTPWHPLRLAELAAKAGQAAGIIQRIVTNPGDKTREVEQYIKARIEGFQQTYYANVAVMRTDSGPQLLIETEARSGYSLLERPFWEDRETLANEPIHHAVEKFGEIAEEYLKLHPHERANFASVLLDAEAEELPRLVAKYLAGRIEDEDDLRCELTVTHEDAPKLRQIYERQNRHIGHEIEAALMSEAGHSVLSRLRIGIKSTASLAGTSGCKRQDIVLLHDVIARQSNVTWHEPPSGLAERELRKHVPTDISRRKSQLSGGLSTSAYLTSPWQVAPSQAYLDAMHDVWEGRAGNASAHFLPAQTVELGSRSVAQKLTEAHKMANWVITYDRIADRRLISRSETHPRILRYFSAPRSFHNVIVSTDVTHDDLRDRLREDIEHILPGHSNETLDRLVTRLQQRSTSLSGSIVMRGAHWDNYARELIGLIVAQREIELLLSEGEVHQTAMFFLDEFRDWLDLSGEIADILAVDLHNSAETGARVRLVIVEAKYVGGGGSVSERSKRSWMQLEGTYTAIANRFTANEATMDPAIWRHRLADMLMEHMDPWRGQVTVAERGFDEWLNLIRQGSIPFEVSGHSILAVRDKVYDDKDREPKIDVGKDAQHGSKRLAQWKLGSDCIAKTIREIADGEQGSPQLYEPQEWTQVGSTTGREAQNPELQRKLPANTNRPTGETSERGHQEHELRARDPRVENAGGTLATGGTPTLGTSKPQTAAEVAANLQPGADGEAADPKQSEFSDASIHASEDGDEQGAGVGTKQTHETCSGWKLAIHECVVAMRRPKELQEGTKWLEEAVKSFKLALQAVDMQAPVENAVLTPNSALLHVGGRTLTVKWLESKRTDLMTGYGVEIIRITPMAGRIAVALKRPRRGILHLSEVWTRRRLEPNAPTRNMAMVVGEQEDDGALFYLSLETEFEGQEQAAPHTLVSGTTGSGKGILVSNLILDVCAFNDPRAVKIYLIDPKRGADYLWARDLPHLGEAIVEEKEAAIALLRRLVAEMEERYRQITQAGCANIAQYNRRRAIEAELPRVIIFFDEVANWMQDEDFKKEVESVINEIATKSRAAGTASVHGLPARRQGRDVNAAAHEPRKQADPETRRRRLVTHRTWGERGPKAYRGKDTSSRSSARTKRSTARFHLSNRMRHVA